MAPKRSTKVGAKAEAVTRSLSTKQKIDLRDLKKDLWYHYESINLKIRNTKPLEGEDTVDNQHQRGTADEDKEHGDLKQLLERYKNIYDYDYDVDIAKEVFKKNLKVDDEDEYTALIWAIKLSSKDNIRDIELMCKYFLKKDENGEPDKLNSILDLDEEGGWNKSTALHKAAEYGRVDVIEFLMNEGADVNIVNSGKFTPFMLAARDGKHEVVEKIIQMSNKKKIELKIFHNDRFRGRFTDLALACSRSDSADGKNHIDSGDHIKVVNYILNHTDDTRAKKVLTAPNKFGKTPLLIACENGLKEIVKLIINKMKALFTEEEFRLEINRFSFLAKTALHLAISNNPNIRDKNSEDTDTSIIEMLLENGAWSDRVQYDCRMEKSDPKYKWLQVYNYITSNIDEKIYEVIGENGQCEKDEEYSDFLKTYKNGKRAASALSILCENKFFMYEPRKIAIFKLLKENAQKEEINSSKIFNNERVDDHNIGQLCVMYEPKYYKEKEIKLLVEILDCVADENMLDFQNQSRLILAKDERNGGKNCLHKACSKGNIGVISVLIDKIIESIQYEEGDQTQDRGSSYTKVLATRKFMEMNYLTQKDHNNMSCMDYLCQYYTKSDQHRKDLEYLFEVALDGPEHKFYLLEMFPKILNALPNPSIIMNDEMMEFIFKKLFRNRNQQSSKSFFHYGKYADVALFDTLVNIAVALKYCAKEKRMGRQILEEKAQQVTKMIVKCIQSQSMDYTSNIADLFRYGLDVREVDANETSMTEETNDVSELRLALTLMSGPLRKCIEYDLIDVLGTAQISPYIERIFTINLKKGVVKPISDTTNLIQLRSNCLYYRYCPIIMFIFECLSKIFFFALVVIVSMYPSSESDNSTTYNYSEMLLITYLIGGIMYNCSAVFNELEYRTEMKAREQFTIKFLVAVAIFLGILNNYTIDIALIFTGIYGLFIWLPDIIKCFKVKGHKIFRYGTISSAISDNYNWYREFTVKLLQQSFQDPWSFLESISLILVFIWFLHREFSSSASILNTILSKLQDKNGKATWIMKHIRADYNISTSILASIDVCRACLNSLLNFLYSVIKLLPMGTYILDFCASIIQWINGHVVSPMDIFGAVTNFHSNVSAATSVQWQRFILSLTKITLAFHILRSMLYVEIYGSLTMSLFEMMKDVKAFLVVFVIPFTGFVFAAYSVVGYSAHYALPDEILNVREVLQIFLPSIALNDTNEDSDIKPPKDIFNDAVLKIIIVTFEVVISVVLTNLLIARMTKSYEKIELSAFNKWIASKAKITMDLLLVQERPSARMLPPPLNIITIIISIYEVISDMIWKEISDIKDAIFGIEKLTLSNMQKHNHLSYSRSISSSMGRDDYVGKKSKNNLWNDITKIFYWKYWFPSFKDSRGNMIYFSITSFVADVIICLILLPFTPFYEISLLSSEITKATINSAYKVMLQLFITLCYPLFYSIYIGIIIKELILRLRTSVTRLVSFNNHLNESTNSSELSRIEAKNKEFKNVKEVFWGTLLKESYDVDADDGGSNIYDAVKSMYRGWFKAYGVASFVTSIVGNGVNMYMLIKFIYSYKSDDGVNQFLFTQFVKLILCWIKTHLVAVLIEFFMVFIRGIYDYTSKNTNKQSLPESADAYQPGTADLEKIKQYYNGSVKVKIERLHVEDPLPLSRGVQLSREIRPYVVVYFGNNGMDAKNNESRRKTKTIPVEKDKKGNFKVDIYEELWFKNEKEESGEDPSLKFVVWNRHIGDNNGNGKDSEPLYYAAIPKFEEWIANGLYLGRVQLHRYGHHDDDTKLKNCYIQVTFEVKYSKETNIYSANLYRATSNTNNKSKLLNKSDRRKKSSIVDAPIARQHSNTTYSDGTKEKYKNDFDCQYLEGYNNEKDMFKGCDISTKIEIEGREVEFEGHIGEYNEVTQCWMISSWKSKRRYIANDESRRELLMLPSIIYKNDLLKDDSYKIYKVNKKNKDVLNNFQFFRKIERDYMYNSNSNKRDDEDEKEEEG